MPVFYKKKKGWFQLSQISSFVESESHQRELIKRYKRLVYLVGKYKATYPSEIAKETGLAADAVGKALYKLEKAGVLERLYPDAQHPDKRLLARKTEMIKKGIRGTERWSQMHWVGLADKLVITRTDGVKVDALDRPIHEEKYGGYRDLSNELRKVLN